MDIGECFADIKANAPALPLIRCSLSPIIYNIDKRNCFS